MLEADGIREAEIKTAEGQKASAILKAEGIRQQQILEAEGEAEAVQTLAQAERFRQITTAEGEAKAIEQVYGAIHAGDPTNDLIAIKYLETLGTMADGQATKIYLPTDTSGLLSSIAGVGELLRATQESSEGERPTAG